MPYADPEKQKAHNKAYQEINRKKISDHKVGLIRGLLCDKCNLGLGMFMDDSNSIHRALLYIREHS
jgi:hypothetical protein